MGNHLPTRILLASLLVPIGVGAQGGATGIAGKGEWPNGTPDESSLTLSATLLPNGSAVGYSRGSLGFPQIAIGPVVQVVPPSGAVDYWCINVRPTNVDPSVGDMRLNWYIRDVGDGRSSFDQVTLHPMDVGVDCTTFPNVSGVFETLRSGDFRSH
jgi:hypothetical protein